MKKKTDVQQLSALGWLQGASGLTSDQLKKMIDSVALLCSQGRGILKQASQRAMRDPDTFCVYSKSSWGEKDGRLRVELSKAELEKNWSELLEWIEGVRRSLPVQLYLQAPRLRYVAIEEMNPSEDAINEWHFDGVQSRLKLILFLQDCRADHGSTVYLEGSHRKTHDLFFHFWLTFVFGLKYAAPSGPLVDSLQSQEVSRDMKCGEFFMFDNIGVHRGSTTASIRRVVIIEFEQKNWWYYLCKILRTPGA